MATEYSPPKRLAYSINEAVQLTTLSKSTIRNLINNGTLEITRVGGRTLITAASLERLVYGEVL